MSVLRDPSDWDPLETAEGVEPLVEHKVVRRSLRPLGRGCLVCPCCELPMLPAFALPVSAPLECPFCREIRPASQFLRLGRVDTASNHVVVQARMPA